MCAFRCLTKQPVLVSDKKDLIQRSGPFFFYVELIIKCEDNDLIPLI
jgi:hypothetical protein